MMESQPMDQTVKLDNIKQWKSWKQFKRLIN